VRPSGTEPKLKCYLEVVVPIDEATRGDEGDEAAIGAARIVASQRLDRIRADLAHAAGL
jgi:phosphomannomutase